MPSLSPRRLSLFSVLALAVLPTAPLGAQVDASIASTRARLRSSFEAKVKAKLPLSQNEAQVFWPLFREYREDTAWVGERANELFQDFVDSYPTMDDAKASQLLRDWVNVQQQRLDVRTRWVDRFLAALPAKTVTRFFQLENQFDTLVQSEIAKGVPLVKVTPPSDFLDPLRNPLDVKPVP
jgi:hypothetical protein